MDVLEYWSPTVDWSQFGQGNVTDQVWSQFLRVVQLSHARCHWETEVHNKHQARLPASLYPESNYYRRKQQAERDGDIKRCETHMHRAGYLTADRMSSMSYAVSRADPSNADWKLWLSLWLALRYQPTHDRIRCDAAAFAAFQSQEELMGSPDDGWPTQTFKMSASLIITPTCRGKTLHGT